MSRKTIITVAVTGNHTKLEHHPGLPCTPEQIANAAIESARAGAAIAHIHVRYPDGRPSMELSHYREVVDRIRSSGVDLLINLTTGPGGRFVPSDDDPQIAAPASNLLHPLKRVEHVVALKPDICSLDLNTMWSESAVVINTPRNLRIMADAIRAAGVKPELEVFDSGDIRLACDLLQAGVLDPNPLFQIVCGVNYGFGPTPATLMYARSLLPQPCEWAAFSIGRHAFPFVAQAFLLGGHVRVGFEDAVRLDRKNLAPSNAAMVEKAVRIITDLGGEPATASEARSMLHLPS